MDTQDFKEKILKIATIFCICVIFILGYDKVGTILKTLFQAFVPFLIGGIIALILNITVKFLENKIFKKWNKNKFQTKCKRILSITISLLLTILFIGGIGFLVVPEIASAITELSSSLPLTINRAVDMIQQNVPLKDDWVENLNIFKEATTSWHSLVKYVSTFVPVSLEKIDTAVDTVKNIIGSVINVVIAFIFSIYIILQKEDIANFGKRFVITYIKPEKSKHIFHFLDVLHNCFEDFIYGQCLECFLVALIFTIVASILGFNCSIIIGIVMFFLAFIPYVGNFISCAIGMILTLGVEGVGSALGICLLFCIIQILDGYFLYPKIIGLKVNMPPILIFISAIAGGNLFGFVGMFISIPVVTTFYTLIKERMDLKSPKKTSTQKISYNTAKQNTKNRKKKGRSR